MTRGLERSLKRGALNQARELDRVDGQLRKLPDGARVRVAREQVSQLRSLNRQTKQLPLESCSSSSRRTARSYWPSSAAGR